MAKKKSDLKRVISLDAFGSAKNYWICWIRSSLSQFFLAHRMQTNLKQPCSFIGSIRPEEEHPGLTFPMYLMSFNLEYDIDLVLLANHCTAPMEMSLSRQNPLLGGLLFEDDYYLFNNEGLAKIPFSHPQTDYILMLSADKQTDMEDYVALLPNIPGIRIVCQDTPQNIAKSQKRSTEVLDFIQYLFYEAEAAAKEHRRQKLFAKLNHKMSVAEANYGHLKFPMEDNRIITSPLLRREDL